MSCDDRKGCCDGDLSAANAIRGVVDSIEAARAWRQKTLVSTGMVDVDAFLGGFGPGELVVLAGKPGVGKTAMALQIALNAALKADRVLFVSFEMGEATVAMRIASMLSGVSFASLRSGEASDDELAAVKSAKEELNEVPLSILGASRLSVDGIRREVSRLHGDRFGGISLLVVDYLSMVTPVSREIPRQEQVDGVGKALKQLAVDFRIPVLAVSHLMRSSKGEWPSNPVIACSPSIEQDADSVLIIDREVQQTNASLTIQKSRFGGVGVVDLLFAYDRLAFANINPEG